MSESAKIKRSGVTVYVIGYKGDRWLPKCVESLRKASSQRLSLVLIDNVDNPCLQNLDVAAFDTRIVRTPHPMGFADAHNFGITKAPPVGEWIVLLNQDTISEPGWIDRCVEAMLARPALGLLSPCLLTFEGDKWDPHFRECMEAAGFMSFPGSAGVLAGDSLDVTGAAMVVRREVLAELGLFDPVFESYYEDYDFCRRVRQSGRGIGVCVDARVRHFSGSATVDRAAERRRTTWILRNRVIHDLRQKPGGRWHRLLGHLLFEFPRRFARGFLRTNSSQPLACTWRAYLGVLALATRLVSERRDQEAWHRHLDRIAWRDAFEERR